MKTSSTTTSTSRANVLTGHGYVVVHPSVDFEIGFPGEAWLKGVTAAANKLIELGIADSAQPRPCRAQSYGGYATNLLVTQTNRFKAAVNISGKVDMISFYTDSPRLGVRNVNAAEKTQDRIGATMWQQPQKYVAASARSCSPIASRRRCCSSRASRTRTSRRTTRARCTTRCADSGKRWCG